MQHAFGRCERCGERLYEQLDGGYVCSNCHHEHDDDHFDENGDDEGGRRVKAVVA